MKGSFLFHSEYIVLCCINLATLWFLSSITERKLITASFVGEHEINAEIANNVPGDATNQLKLLDKKLYLQQMIIFTQDNKVEAWHMFTISKRFIVSFIGSVIPFSVMLIQMLQVQSEQPWQNNNSSNTQ